MNAATLLPARVRTLFRLQRDKLRLATIARAPIVSTDALTRAVTPAMLSELFATSDAQEWTELCDELTPLGVTERADGINPGDRRALYALIRHLRPARVLEIGTHIGASTVHIAAALRRNGRGEIASVDIADVNDRRRQPWRRFGARMSPRDLISRIGMTAEVTFVAQRSLDFLAATREPFDFIFLDGDHSAPTVYREIPAAVRVLAPGGVILLHDFFPDAQPLWPDGMIIPGGWLAIERLRREGAKLSVVPFGDLPWPTKQHTSRTSLAVVVGA